MRAAIVAVVLLAGGCLASPALQRGYPLYPVAAAAPAPDQVARLNIELRAPSAPGAGVAPFVKLVDGREVGGLGSAFELLPGCHVVETASRLFFGGRFHFHAEMEPRVFPFRMRAGYEYALVVELPQPYSLQRMSVFAVEKDATGAQVQEIAASTRDDDLRTCRDWTPPS